MPQASGEPISVDELLRPASGAETEPPEPDADLPRAASILESLLLVSTEPIPIEKARQLLGGLNRAQVREVLALLRAKYPADSSGILVEEVAKGFQFRTNPANQEHVRRLFDVKPPRFSRAALETLAIIAYKQPLTRQEIEQIRGVDCAGSLKTLMDRRLVKVMGKKDVPGKPFLFGTSREFMETFSLGSLSELPSMREIEDFLAASTGTAGRGRPADDAPAGDPRRRNRAGRGRARREPGRSRAGGGRGVRGGREDPAGRDRSRAVGRGLEGVGGGERARKWRLSA